MKEPELQAIIAYRLERATKTVAEAQLMQREGHWNACANRLYANLYVRNLGQRKAA